MPSINLTSDEKQLIQSLEAEPRNDAEIKSELDRRLNQLLTGADKGLSFLEVFGVAD